MNDVLVILNIVLTVLVLSVSAYVVYQGIQEGKQRNLLTRRMDSAIEVVSRENYLLTLARYVRDAKTEVLFLSSTITREGDETALRELRSARDKAIKRTKIYQAIIPTEQSRMEGGYELMSAGVDMLMSKGLLDSDLNFTIIDGEVAVLGLPLRPGGPNENSVIIHSGPLIKLLREYCRTLLASSEPFKNFAVRRILQMRDAGNQPNNIEVWTGIPPSTQEEWTKDI